jgi:uncharacterized protein
MTTNELLHVSLILLMVQGLLGAFDTLYHHELTQDLAHQPTARLELKIHAVRSMLYGVLFALMANAQLQGALVYVIVTLIGIEVGLTLWDFVVEDHSRLLPSSERITHTILAINGGAIFVGYGFVLFDWQAMPTEVQHLNRGWLTAVLTVMAVGVFLSGVRDAHAAWVLGRREVQSDTTNPFARLVHRRFLITGATGFIGQQLVDQLLKANHEIVVLTRSPLAASIRFQAKVRCIQRMEELDLNHTFDAVVHLAGARVLGMPWTAQQKEKLLSSRIEIAKQIQTWLAKANHKPAVWIQASAIGFYGAREPKEVLTESSAPSTGFMSELCQAIEAQAAAAESMRIRVVNLRLGLVLGHGGPLPMLALPFRFFFGGRMGRGQQIVSWIHLSDVLDIIARAVDKDDMTGSFNAVSPSPVAQTQLAQGIAQQLRRPSWFHLPAKPFRLLMGEMSQLLLDGQRVVPYRLVTSGYEFLYPNLDQALSDLLSHSDRATHRSA